MWHMLLPTKFTLPIILVHFSTSHSAARIFLSQFLLPDITTRIIALFHSCNIRGQLLPISIRIQILYKCCLHSIIPNVVAIALLLPPLENAAAAAAVTTFVLFVDCNLPAICCQHLFVIHTTAEGEQIQKETKYIDSM